MVQALKFGGLTGIVICLYTLALHLAGLGENQALPWLVYLILAAGIFLAHASFKKANNGYMGYGKGILLGVVTSAVTGVITAIYSYFHYSKIAPEILENRLADGLAQQEAMLAQQGMSPEEIEAMLAQTQKFLEIVTSPAGIMVMTIFGFLLFGVILSLIVSIFTQNRKPEAA